ncbi:MAG: 7-carboxy-7-deazaguanine synthase QueE [Planctomycetota bacterium]|nr:7-carboxy-7-deazaguanine synthase QueE [Planctomycetota bacterium]
MSSTSTQTQAPVMEVFASLQGEGRYVGQPQVFLRLRGCPLRCRWCDTPGSWRLADAEHARVATEGGPERRPTWATPFQAACWVAECEPREPRPVSVTGGEPLLWPGFLLELRDMLGGRRMHLETAGAHPEALARVAAVCDHISLDLKLPADLDRPESVGEGNLEPVPTDADSWTATRRACLAIVTERDAATKIVVVDGRRRGDYAPLLEDQARLAPDLPLYLQPATPVAGLEAPSIDLLTELAEDARDLDLEVRVIPQVHRFLRIP